MRSLNLLAINRVADFRIPGRIPTNTSHEARIYPLPHTYVVKDLVPDLTQFYKQYKSIKPYLQRETKTEDVRPPTLISFMGALFPLLSSLLFTKLTPIPFFPYKTGPGKPPKSCRPQEARWTVRMHPVRLLLDVLPLVLVEQRGIPRPGRAPAVLPLAGRFP